jgi:hypothetical protein
MIQAFRIDPEHEPGIRSGSPQSHATPGAFVQLPDAGGGTRKTAGYPKGDEPLIPMLALTLDALSQTATAVTPSRLRSSSANP